MPAAKRVVHLRAGDPRPVYVDTVASGKVRVAVFRTLCGADVDVSAIALSKTRATCDTCRTVHDGPR